MEEFDCCGGKDENDKEVDWVLATRELGRLLVSLSGATWHTN